MRAQLQSRIDQIERMIVRASSRDVPEDIQSYMARFGAILVCGFIERAVEIVITERLSNRAQQRVLNFIKSHFKRGTNYDCPAIEQLLLRFDTEWHKKFCDFISHNEDIREGIASVYGVRNSVAHGGSNSVGLKRLKELFEISQRLVSGVIDATA